MRKVIKVAPDQVASRFETAANLAVAKAIHEHNKAGRETYTMRDGKIVTRQPTRNTSTDQTIVVDRKNQDKG